MHPALSGEGAGPSLAASDGGANAMAALLRPIGVGGALAQSGPPLVALIAAVSA